MARALGSDGRGNELRQQQGGEGKKCQLRGDGEAALSQRSSPQPTRRLVRLRQQLEAEHLRREMLDR